MREIAVFFAIAVSGFLESAAQTKKIDSCCQEKLLHCIVEYIGTKCSLPDSSKNKLSTLLKKYKSELRANTRNCEDCNTAIRQKFYASLREEFGERVYEVFRAFILLAVQILNDQQQTA